MFSLRLIGKTRRKEFAGMWRGRRSSRRKDSRCSSWPRHRSRGTFREGVWGVRVEGWLRGILPSGCFLGIHVAGG